MSRVAVFVVAVTYTALKHVAGLLFRATTVMLGGTDVIGSGSGRLSPRILWARGGVEQARLHRSGQIFAAAGAALLCFDITHPNGAGQRIMARAVAAHLLLANLDHRRRPRGCGITAPRHDPQRLAVILESARRKRLARATSRVVRPGTKAAASVTRDDDAWWASLSVADRVRLAFQLSVEQ